MSNFTILLKSDIHFLAGATFLHTKIFACPAVSNQSRQDNQSMGEHCWLGLRDQPFSNNKHLLRLTQMRGRIFYLQVFSIILYTGSDSPWGENHS